MVIQTLGDPPSTGSIILATNNCNENSKNAEINKVEMYMKFTNISQYFGRLYILFGILVSTLLSLLLIYQAYNSKFLNSSLLKIVIPGLAIIGFYALILPTQTPQKLGIKPNSSTQRYLDEIVNRKLEYRISPNDKIEIYEIPQWIIWRKKVVYIGVALLINDKDILAQLILNELNTSSVNPLKQELAFWQGIDSVTSNNFQFWKPFTNWYIHHLSNIADTNNSPSNISSIFNYYIINKLKQKEFDIFESYVSSSNNQVAISSAIELDKYCKKMWLAGHAILSNTELTLDNAELPKYEDVCHLGILDVVDISPEIIELGLIERTALDSYTMLPLKLNDVQYMQIAKKIAAICPHVYVTGIAKKQLQYLPQIPSFVVTCVQQKTYFDINERTHLIEKQLQSKINEMNGDWTIIVTNKKSKQGANIN